jgi:hypothetical protein
MHAIPPIESASTDALGSPATRVDSSSLRAVRRHSVQAYHTMSQVRVVLCCVVLCGVVLCCVVLCCVVLCCVVWCGGMAAVSMHGQPPMQPSV